MVAWLQLTSILLVCLLSELENSSAFPKARGPIYPEALQGLKTRQQELFNSGTRPFQHVEALRQGGRKLQPSVRDQVWVKPWQRTRGSSSYSQPQNGAPQTQSPKRISLPQIPSGRNLPLPRPRGFEFSLKVPFINKGTRQTVNGSDIKDGSDSYRPTSVQIHSSFNKPGLGGFSGKGSTNSEKDPSFDLSVSVPILSGGQSPKPSSKDGDQLPGVKGPGPSGYTEPSKPQSGLTQSGSGATLVTQLQQQTNEQLYQHVHVPPGSISPEHVGKHEATVPQVSLGQIHSGQNQEFPKLDQVPYLSIEHRPQLYDGGYYVSQTKPAKGQSSQTLSQHPTKPVDASALPVPEKVYSGYPSQIKPTKGQMESQHPPKPAEAPSIPVYYPQQYVQSEYNPSQIKPTKGQSGQMESQHPPKPAEAPSIPVYYPQQYVQSEYNPSQIKPTKGQSGQMESQHPTKPVEAPSPLVFYPQQYVQSEYDPSQIKPAKGQSGQMESQHPPKPAEAPSIPVYYPQQYVQSEDYPSQIKPTKGQSGQMESQHPPKPAEAPSLPVYDYPQQYGNVYSGYHPSQMKPTKGQSGQMVSSPTQVEAAVLPVHGNVYSGYPSQTKPTKGQTDSEHPTKLAKAPSIPVYYPQQYVQSEYDASKIKTTQGQTGSPTKGQTAQTGSPNPANPVEAPSPPVYYPQQYVQSEYYHSQTKPTKGQSGQTVSQHPKKPVDASALPVPENVYSGYPSQTKPTKGQSGQIVSSPTKQVDASALPYYAYPQHYGNVYTEYYPSQTKPTKGQSGQMESQHPTKPVEAPSPPVFYPQQYVQSEYYPSQIKPTKGQSGQTNSQHPPKPAEASSLPVYHYPQQYVQSEDYPSKIKPTKGQSGQMESQHPPKPAEAPSLPVYDYPQQYGNVYSGYHPSQLKPTKGQSGQMVSSPTQVEAAVLPVHGNVYSGYPSQTKPTKGQTDSEHPTKLAKAPLIPVYYPQQYVQNEYDASKIKAAQGQTGSPYPTKVENPLPSASQYETVPPGHYGAAQVQPSGNGYRQHLAWQLVSTQPAFVSGVYGQNMKTDSPSSLLHTSAPVIAPPQYEIPHYTTGSMGQTDLSSSYQYSKQQNGRHVLPNTHLTASHSLPNFPDLSAFYQTHMTLPRQDTGKGQMSVNPSYTKIFIDVEAESGLHGKNYGAPPIAHYVGYPGQSRQEALQSAVSVNQNQHSETQLSQKRDSYVPTMNQAPSVNSGVGQYPFYPQKQNGNFQTSIPPQVNKAPHVTANIGQKPFSQSNANPGGQMQQQQPTDQNMNYFTPTDQYPTGHIQLQQPASYQHTDYYAMSNGLNPYSAYSLNH